MRARDIRTIISRASARLAVTAAAVALAVAIVPAVAHADATQASGSFPADESTVNWRESVSTERSKNGKATRICSYPAVSYLHPRTGELNVAESSFCERFRHRRGRVILEGVDAAEPFRHGWLTEQPASMNVAFPGEDARWIDVGALTLVTGKDISAPTVQMAAGSIPLQPAGSLRPGLRVWVGGYGYPVQASSDTWQRVVTARKRSCKRGKCEKRNVTIWKHLD